MIKVSFKSRKPFLKIKLSKMKAFLLMEIKIIIFLPCLCDCSLLGKVYSYNLELKFEMRLKDIIHIN